MGSYRYRIHMDVQPASRLQRNSKGRRARGKYSCAAEIERGAGAPRVGARANGLRGVKRLRASAAWRTVTLATAAGAKA